MKKLFLVDLLVKCVVLIISALIWFGPANAAAQEITVVTTPTVSVLNPVARLVMLTGVGLLVSAVFAALIPVPECPDR